MSEPHERLDQAMQERGLELKKRWVNIADDAGVTTSALGAIRRGEYRPSPHTARGIETALQWAPGSVDAILGGGQPTPVVPDRREGEDEFARLDRLYEEWKHDPHRGPVLRELLETWGDRDAG
ncbi:helix-turn-helix domain-containing protein [Spirillospora sp. NBC_01491]|uniref:helix-turn-helix domain-containing protein n=1 Tax=Spirillospora sp. NBC_01491 TaxID=2976007 RepID=UPI002E36E450|nr:helix-turn-helix transcriptional regulator [Spirillospora sp. NBC_01491]